MVHLKGVCKIFLFVKFKLSLPEDLLPKDLIFVWEFIDFGTFSRKMFALQWSNCLFEIFFVLEILLISSAIVV